MLRLNKIDETKYKFTHFFPAEITLEPRADAEVVTGHRVADRRCTSCRRCRRRKSRRAATTTTTTSTTQLLTTR